jgi:hypothetical protein
MSLSVQRHTEVEATLQDMEEYLTALAGELDASVGFNGHSHSADTARNVIEQLAILRYALQRDLENRRIMREIRRRPQKAGSVVVPVTSCYRIRARSKPPLKAHQLRRLAARLDRLGDRTSPDEWICKLDEAQLAEIERLYSHPEAPHSVSIEPVGAS